MINTQIITHTEDERFPVIHKYTGFAKNLKEWRFAMNCAGWMIGFNCETYAYEIERIEWPEGDQYFPYDQKELYVLGGCLIMN